MMILGLIKNIWKEIFTNLYLVGKIILFPIFFGFTILVIPFSVFLFCFFEIPAFIIILLIKDGNSFKEKFSFFYDLLNW